MTAPSGRRRRRFSRQRDGWAAMLGEWTVRGGGYEVEITPFSPAAAGQIVDESLALLREIADTRKR